MRCRTSSAARGLSPTIIAVLLATLLLRALIPSGYMLAPAPAAGGAPFAVVICSASGAHTQPSETPAVPAPGKTSDAGQPCAFAASLATAIPPAQMIAIAGPMASADGHVLRPSQIPAVTPVGPQLGARAPPVRG